MRTIIQAIARLVIPVIVTPVILITGILNAKASEAATYWASPSGSDNNGCNNSSTPLTTTAKRTIAAAVGCTSPGDTVSVRAGTYAGFMLTDKRGAPGAYITIKATPGEHVVIDGFLGSIAGIGLEGVCQYLIFDGFEITSTDPVIDQIKSLNFSNSNDITSGAQLLNSALNVKGPGIGFNSASARPWHNNLILQNLKIHHGLWEAISGRVDDVQFLNNEIYDQGPNSGYAFYVTGQRNIWRGNLIHDTIYGMHLYGGGVYALEDSIIENNIFHDTGGTFMNSQGAVGYGRALIILPGNNNIVRNNIFYNTKSLAAIQINSTNTKVYNNTIYNNRRALGGVPDPVVGIAVGAGGGIVKNNIVYQNDVDIQNDAGASVSNNLTTDPKFIDAAVGNFKVQSASPAIDRGVALSDVPGDFNGTKRPQGNGYDIGAYEYIGSVIPPSTPMNVQVTR